MSVIGRGPNVRSTAKNLNRAKHTPIIWFILPWMFNSHSSHARAMRKKMIHRMKKPEFHIFISNLAKTTTSVAATATILAGNHTRAHKLQLIFCILFHIKPLHLLIPNCYFFWTKKSRMWSLSMIARICGLTSVASLTNRPTIESASEHVFLSKSLVQLAFEE